MYERADSCKYAKTFITVNKIIKAQQVICITSILYIYKFPNLNHNIYQRSYLKLLQLHLNISFPSRNSVYTLEMICCSFFYCFLSILLFCLLFLQLFIYLLTRIYKSNNRATGNL